MEKEQLEKWVYRLQHYIQREKNAQTPEQKNIAITALLGYLSSLEIIIKE